MRALVLLPFLAAACYSAAPQTYFSEPSISPDGSEIAFVSGGDIWTVPARGGEARLLVSHPATESRPLYSPDGKFLAFTSNRTGNGDVYLLTFDTGELTRLTFDDANEMVEGWSPDSRWIYFSSSARDIAGMTDILRVSRDGGTPMTVTGDRYVEEYFAAPAPSGGVLAFTARGFAGTQWWRNGHSHLDESEIWLRREGRAATYERLTEGGAKEAWPMWSKDARDIYYMSDRSGAQNIWKRPLNGKAQQVTRFTDGRVSWPSISADGRSIVFERDFRIWKLDTGTGKSAPVEIARRGVPAGPAVQHISLSGQFQQLALSPDGKKVAFASHGEIFAASAKDGGDAARLTQTAAPESLPAWAPDSRRLAYVSQRNGKGQIFLYDFATGKEAQLTEGPDDVPRFSPDGKTLAFLRGGTELRALDLASKQDRVLAKGRFGLPPLTDDSSFAWSPDSRWLAYVDVGDKSFRNVWVASLESGEPRPISFLANYMSGELAWSPDGKYILFLTAQRTEETQLARIDLIPRTPHFREDQFRDLFRDPKQPEKPPASDEKVPDGGKAAEPEQKNASGKAGPPQVKIVFEDIRNRLSLLSTGLSVDGIVIAPDGKTAVLTAVSVGQQNLYSYSLDDLAKEAPVARQLTSTPGAKDNLQFTPDSKELFYLSRGSIYSVSLDSRQPKQLSANAEMDVDFSREKMEVFEQAWTYLRDQFFDPKFNGVDWNAVRAEYEPLIAGSTTPDEMRTLLSLMIGELNASHLGATAPPGAAQVSTGRLGLRFDRETYESSGKLKIVEVIPLSPADVAGVKAGETLDAVEGVAINAQTNLDRILDHTIGKRVSLTVSGREVPIQPVNLATEKALLYRAWVNHNRDYVAKISNGRLGYVHMEDMSQGALDRLALDLDAENQSREGVVIDLRNNTGGFVNAYALDVFARRPYLRMTERGLSEAPARAVLGQRALEEPTILVVNQHSLSDAEDFTEGYRSLHLGKVVGEPTSGWIIYTWGGTLMDGTRFRLPHSRIRTAAGEDMEMHPRPVDIAASRPVGESYTDRDSQLDAAVKELLAELPARPKAAREAPLAPPVREAALQRPTFYRDILPILQDRCQECHRPNEIAPMPFLNYQQVRPWAKSIRTAVLTGKMPPWFADPCCGKFENDRSLSQAERETLTEWSETGAAQGDPRDAPPPKVWTEGWNLPTPPDRVFSMAQSFMVPASGAVEYQYFAIPTNFKEDRWISAAEARPGNRNVVHHAVVYIREPGSTWTSGPTKADILTIYSPGSSPDVSPPGMAKLVKAGSDLVLEIHYTPKGKPVADRTQVAVDFAKSPPIKRVLTLQMDNSTFRIPPGDRDYRVTAWGTLPNDALLLGFFPHMHLRGKSFEYDRIRDDGQPETLLKVAPYDFYWQLSYRLAQPIPLKKGTRLEWIGTFDNSANNPRNPDPTAEVRYGHQSWEEMMIGFFDVAVDPGVDKSAFFARGS